MEITSEAFGDDVIVSNGFRADTHHGIEAFTQRAEMASPSEAGYLGCVHALDMS